MTDVPDVVLGADLGTSALKLVALDADNGALVAEAEAGYRLESPAPGWAQVHVGTWRGAFAAALAELDPRLAGRRVLALGLSGQMHGAVLVDESGAAVAPALLWPDTRAADQVRRWRELAGAKRAALANPLVAGMTGPLLAWLAEHEPALIAHAAGVLLPKDALRAALMREGERRVTDRSDGSATLLWNVPADTWSLPAVAAAGIGPELLPAVRPATAVVGTMPIRGSEVPVVVGGADTPLALLAAGSPRGLLVNLGTGAQLLHPSSRPAPADDPPVHAYADVEDGWYAMAALRNGGSAWAWAGEVLGLSAPRFFAAAAEAQPGAGGVLFQPFLTGERGAVAGSGGRAGWTGMQASTTRADLARAAVEGVLFAVATSAGLLGLPADGGPVLLTGGGGRDPLVRQLLADVLARPVSFLPLRSASAVGAAMLAARGAGRDLAPNRAPSAPSEPRPAPQLAATARAWAEQGRGGTAAPLVR